MSVQPDPALGGKRLVLGSASPRRREILETLGIGFTVLRTDIDEGLRSGEAPAVYLERIVAAKLAGACALARGEAGEGEPREHPGDTLFLVADTIVQQGARILGKPSSVAEAQDMLRALSGVTHEVHTRFALGKPAAGAKAGVELLHAETVTTRVTFRALDEAEIAGYARTGEGLDKAGGYAIQGLGSFAALRIDGSYTNVVGLPACEVVVALRSVGFLPRFPP